MAEARITPEEECCGLLLAHPASPDGQIDLILPAANAAEDRGSRFEIAPSVLIRAHKAERDGLHRIIGCYHSHPGGNASPSSEDAALAAPDGGLWLICAGPPWTATLWRSGMDGIVHGRFTPVPLTIENGP